MARAVSINNDHQVFPNPGFSRLKNNACLVLTEPGSVQACGPGVLCVRLGENIIRPIRKEPQIHSPLAELSACYARGHAGNADERRYGYNNIINIFQPQPRTSPSRPREACT